MIKAHMPGILYLLKSNKFKGQCLAKYFLKLKIKNLKTLKIDYERCKR